jgi:hypothetical protein
MSLAAALLAFQAEARKTPIKREATGQIGSREYHYATLDDVMKTIGPLLKDQGLVWTTKPGTDTEGNPVLSYKLLHVETKEDSTGQIPLLGVNTMQDLGSAITYARRYAIQCVLDLIVEDDDDGKAASESPKSYGKQGFKSGGGPSVKQREELQRQFAMKKPSKDSLRIMLDTIGVDAEIKEGWMEYLTPGRDGTASALISWFKEKPIPTGESDVPADDGFEHEKPPQDETLPFS